MNGERTLGVWLERQHIGSIVHVPPEKGDMSVFLLDESYRQNPERLVLSLSFAADNGMLAYAPRYINTRVHPFLSNLLPEGQLRDYLAHESGVKPQREFNLLAALGEDLPGGVVVLPESEQMAPDLGHGQDVSLPAYQEGETLKFSLSGVQLKMSAVENARGGLTIPAYGRGGSWIVKLPSTHFEAVPENEFTMMRLAEQLGLSVPKTHLLPVMDVEGLPKGMRRTENLFAIQRFDRDAHGGRIHMEDFAQVFGRYPEQKYHQASYHNMADVLLRTSGLSSVQDFIRRITFMTAIGNGDMHLKNWSLLYPDGRHPELSPVYDMLSTLPYVSKRENMGLSFANSKDFQDYSSSRITLFAERLGIEPSLLLAPAKHLAEAFPDIWSSVKRDTPLPAYMQEMVDTHVRSIALFQEVHPSLFSARQEDLGAAQTVSTPREISMSPQQTAIPHSDDAIHEAPDKNLAVGTMLRLQARGQAQNMRNRLREQLVPAVLRYLPVESVWVFGSVARDEPSVHSDADVLLMLATEVDEKNIFRAIRKALRDAELPFSCDVIAWTPNGYADRATSGLAFFDEIMKERILIWESTNNHQNQCAG